MPLFEDGEERPVQSLLSFRPPKLMQRVSNFNRLSYKLVDYHQQKALLQMNLDIMNQETTLTVTQLNRQVRYWLEHDVGDVHVTGELSNLSKPSSGHLYFTLKDENAQLRCVFFRNLHRRDSKNFIDGQQVIIKGKLSLYEARGDYQLIVQSLSPAGLGELYQQFERLKAKLELQGLFAAQRKKPLPLFPGNIAVITSASGAALHDILSTLARRFPLVDVHIYPSEVQGRTAAKQLCNAIIQANADNKSNVILLARGGGSIEDLWPFNDEQLALTISQSKIPVVSGVGHETDFTIADFVADLRAATPTAAAEAATPDKLALLKLIGHYINRMQVAANKIMQRHQLILSHHIAKISSPEQLIAKHWQTLDYLERQLNQLLLHKFRHNQHRLQMTITRLQSQNPAALLQQSKSGLHYIKQQITQLASNRINDLKQQFMQQLTTLHAVSPLATLNRGYAIATIDHAIIYSSRQVHLGDNINLQLAKDHITCSVIKKD